MQCCSSESPNFSQPQSKSQAKPTGRTARAGAFTNVGPVQQCRNSGTIARSSQVRPAQYQLRLPSLGFEAESRLVGNTVAGVHGLYER